MGKRDFKEFIQEAVQSSGFFVAAILKAAVFVLSVVSGFLTVPFSISVVGSIIGTLIGGLFNLFLIVFPLFEILRAKNSQNFKNDCDFGLKFLRISAIIALIVSALFVVAAFILTFTVDFKLALMLLLSGVMLGYSIIQLEIINDLRNGLFYNIEKVSYAFVYLLLNIVICIVSVAYMTVNSQYFDAVIQLLSSCANIIFAYLILKANTEYQKHLH